MDEEIMFADDVQEEVEQPVETPVTPDLKIYEFIHQNEILCSVEFLWFHYYDTGYIAL